MPIGTPTAQLADNLLEGRLADQLRIWRQEGESWDSIAKLLWVETDQAISVTGPTVQAWASRLGVDGTTRAAS